MKRFCPLCYSKGYMLEEFDSEYNQSRDFYKVPCKRCNIDGYLAKCQEIRDMLAKYQ